MTAPSISAALRRCRAPRRLHATILALACCVTAHPAWGAPHRESSAPVAAPPAAVHRLQRTLPGTATFDNFGFSVSGAGDVNGDGFADVVVGEPGSDAGGVDAGRAYVYYGGPGADAVADLTLTGAAVGDFFGVSVSSAGDFNGDGYADVIVGAPSNDAGGADAGRAYLFYGGPGADAVADLTLAGAAAGDQFGISVSTAGDMNGDGYADVIVGAPYHSDVGAFEGRVYVYHGGQAADAVADLILTGATSYTALGISVSTAGDVNGDGFDDVIAGAPYRLTGTNEGEAYVYYGGFAADTAADLTLIGAAAYDEFGFSVSTAGDVNGDGYADVIVGAHANDDGGFGAGRAYVYFGGPGADAAADLNLPGAAANDEFGYSVSTAGDVNADGFADVIVGAYASSAGGTYGGRAYLYYGGAAADAIADRLFTGATYENLGFSVSTAGDLNGDGYVDLIVGAIGYDGPGQDAGAAYLYDSKRYVVLSPNGGETWNVGATKAVSWLGAEPGDLWLSTDGGMTYDLLESQVGGADQNTFTIRVPHSPTKFARIRVTPSDANVSGSGKSDSTFTIQTSVALLSLLAAPLPQGGASISWSTDPGPGDLAGYRLERSRGGESWMTAVAMTRETSYTDPAGGPGMRYRLFAVNGFGESLWLGETSLRPLKPLAAWPLPYREGPLTISFATAGGLGGGDSETDVSIFDVQGRLVKSVARGNYPQGYNTAVWDGRDRRGKPVASGIYFLRSSSLGEQRTLRLSVLR